MTDELTEHLLTDDAPMPPEWEDWLDQSAAIGEPGDTPGAVVVAAVPAPAEPWHIDGDRTATWALRRLGAAERELDRIDQLAEAEIERVKQWAKTAGRRHARTADFMRARLAEYLRERIEAGAVKLTAKGGGTYELPTGKLTRRAGSQSVVFTDEDRFIGWALANRTELLKVEPRKAATREALLAKDDVLLDPDTGEVVPGVALERGEPIDDAKPSAP